MTTERSAETLTEGDRVMSEWGSGTVLTHTRHSLRWLLDNGEVLSVVRGTPGYYRVTKLADERTLSPGDTIEWTG